MRRRQQHARHLEGAARERSSRWKVWAGDAPLRRAACLCAARRPTAGEPLSKPCARGRAKRLLFKRPMGTMAVSLCTLGVGLPHGAPLHSLPVRCALYLPACWGTSARPGAGAHREQACRAQVFGAAVKIADWGLHAHVGLDESVAMYPNTCAPLLRARPTQAARPRAATGAPAPGQAPSSPCLPAPGAVWAVCSPRGELAGSPWLMCCTVVPAPAEVDAALCARRVPQWRPSHCTMSQGDACVPVMGPTCMPRAIPAVGLLG